MIRTTWKSALTLGAVLASVGAANAGDSDTMKLGGGASTTPRTTSTTMTLGGKGTVAQASTAKEDTELTRGYHGGGFHGGFGGYHGGYHGWGGGWGGYRGWGGYGYRGWGGYGWGGYRGWGGYYRPYYRGYYGGFYGFPYYGYGLGFGGYGLGYGGYGLGYGLGYGGYGGYYGVGYGGYGYGCGTSFYLGISSAAQIITPVTGGTVISPATTPATPPMSQPATPSDGTFPYDGGPSNPVPLPKADPQTIPPAAPSATTTSLPISGKKSITAPATPTYKYRAYGEK